jgi:signal transduction histidine kinase/ABC-type phosphate/phosphonate transport system substrate-binding protein
VLWGLLCIPVQASDLDPAIHFGVLAYRPKPETLARWQPLIDHLNRSNLKQKIVLEALTYSELEEAIQQHRVDLVLSQPAHYVLMAHREGLYSPLATLIESDGDKPLASFGGVIISLANRTDIRTLDDLRGKQIAVSKKESLGGYLAQAYELKLAGINPATEIKITETGTPHDRVVDAVLSQKVDAGFVRTGLIEQMAREGKLNLSLLSVLNAPGLPDYPLSLSTRLYPEWAMAAMPWADPELARQVAATVLSLPHGGSVAKSSNIHGFTIPGNYRMVDDLMRSLHVPPYDKRDGLSEIWDDHHESFSGIAMLLSIIPTILLIRLWHTHRTLARQHNALETTHGQLQMETQRRQETEGALRTADERLAAVDRIESVGRLAAGVSHEVKNPLTIIRFGVDYLASSPSAPTDQKLEVIQDIRDAVERADRIVKGLLDFARNKSISQVSVDLNEVITQALYLTRHELERRRIEIRSDLSPDLPRIIGDPDRLAQVYVNLISNAAQAVGSVGEIAVSTRGLVLDERSLAYDSTNTLRAGEVVIQSEIRDSGPGLSEETRAQLFTPFFTTKVSGEGNGLGLHVARNIILMHGGLLQLQNHPDGGSVATTIFRIPEERTHEKNPDC